MEMRSISQIYIYCVSLMEMRFIYSAHNGKEERLVDFISNIVCPNGKEECLVDLYLLCVPNGKEEWLVDFYLFCAPNGKEE